MKAAECMAWPAAVGLGFKMFYKPAQGPISRSWGWPRGTLLAEDLLLPPLDSFNTLQPCTLPGGATRKLRCCS